MKKIPVVYIYHIFFLLVLFILFFENNIFDTVYSDYDFPLPNTSEIFSSKFTPFLSLKVNNQPSKSNNKIK